MKGGEILDMVLVANKVADPTRKKGRGILYKLALRKLQPCELKVAAFYHKEYRIWNKLRKWIKFYISWSSTGS